MTNSLRTWKLPIYFVDLPLKMVIFHKYVSLPESISYYASIKKKHKTLHPQCFMVKCFDHGTKLSQKVASIHLALTYSAPDLPVAKSPCRMWNQMSGWLCTPVDCSKLKTNQFLNARLSDLTVNLDPYQMYSLMSGLICIVLKTNMFLYSHPWNIAVSLLEPARAWSPMRIPSFLLSINNQKKQVESDPISTMYTFFSVW